MYKKIISNNQNGMTLVELLAVLIILGILAVVAIPRYIDMESNAQKKALDAGLMELNAREHLTWADQVISGSGYMDDLKIFGIYGLNLGALAFSFSEINPFIQFLVLLSTLTFTVIQIVKALSK